MPGEKYTFLPEGNVPFGGVQGYAPGGIPAYSNQHDHFFTGERSLHGDLFCGFKYQCVEFARRWLFFRKGLVLPNVNWACHIFDLASVNNAETGEPAPVGLVKNGNGAKPEVDTLMIWPSREENIVGHVGVVTEVGDDYVAIADQNCRFTKWTAPNYADKLTLKHDAVANTWTVIDDSDPKDVVEPLGWVTFPGAPNRPEGGPEPALHDSVKFVPPAMPYMIRKTFTPTESKANWLDMSNPAEKLFVEEFGMDVGRSRLEEAEASYYEVNQEMHMKCTASGVQLHKIFMEATAQVMADDDQLRLFGIPEEFWPRMRHSYEHQQTYISGRFDFAYNNETGSFKCFEYNADSASTLLECGRVQAKWAESVGLDKSGETRSSGGFMERQLRSAWAKCGAKGRVHFCVDTDREEQYTALYCAEQAQAVGLETKLCIMFDEFHFNEEGKVVDSDNVPVTTVWKTWMWESAIADHYKAREERGADWVPKAGDKVRLCDLLLPKDNFDLMVFEPMWKLIPSNKAILPIIYKNHPEHPAILKCDYELTEELKACGYATKPIVGRIGLNVTITDADGTVEAESKGAYSERNMIYQELFKLTKQEGYYAILGGWMIGDSYGGTGIREDKTIITGVDSPFAAMRIKLDHVMPKPVVESDDEKLPDDE